MKPFFFVDTSNTVTYKTDRIIHIIGRKFNQFRIKNSELMVQDYTGFIVIGLKYNVIIFA